MENVDGRVTAVTVIEMITLLGTELGTAVQGTTTRDGEDGIVTILLGDTVNTQVSGTATGDSHVDGMVTLGGMVMAVTGTEKKGSAWNRIWNVFPFNNRKGW